MIASVEQRDEIISICHQAADANRTTPARCGNVITLDASNADDCLITADLHGHVRNFESILEIAALDEHPRRHLIVQEVCHGGPQTPDGGCQSYQLLERVARLKVRYPDRVHYLLSNHEMAELTDYPILKSKRMLNLAFRMGMQEEYGDATDQVREGYCDLIGSCPLAVRMPGGVFVSHSLPERLDERPFDITIFDRPLSPADMGDTGSVFALVWGRDYRAENAATFLQIVGARVLIHGHEPCRNGFMVPNEQELILDCCNQPACYVLLPMNDSLTHDDIVSRVATLPAGGSTR